MQPHIQPKLAPGGGQRSKPNARDEPEQTWNMTALTQELCGDKMQTSATHRRGQPGRKEQHHADIKMPC